jgi:iron uptake system component EfeO
MPVRIPATLRATAVAATAAATVAVAGCGGESATPTGPPAADGPIPVKAGETSCEVGRTTLKAGTHTFAVTNTGSQVTEFYVYGPGDKVIGEVENIGPSLTRNLTVELPAGTYQTACKPGQVGSGIRGTLTVSAAAAAPLLEDAALTQSVRVSYVQRQSSAPVRRTSSRASRPPVSTGWRRICGSAAAWRSPLSSPTSFCATSPGSRSASRR